MKNNLYSLFAKASVIALMAFTQISSAETPVLVKPKIDPPGSAAHDEAKKLVEDFVPGNADSVRAQTVNQYIGDQSKRYKTTDFSGKNASGKIQLKLQKPGKALGTFDEFGSLAIDGKGPTGKDGEPVFLHYNSPANERDGRDTWGEPQTVCSVLVFAAEWKKKCAAKLQKDNAKMSAAEARENCTLQIGDISLPTKDRNKNGRDALGHKSHYNGNCVDVRPVSPNGLTAGAVYRSNKGQKPTVDLTQDAVNFATSMGATNPIWQSSGHYDHFHVCFPPGNTPDATLSKGKVGKGPLKGCYGLR